jgi:hypothetical protein
LSGPRKTITINVNSNGKYVERAIAEECSPQLVTPRKPRYPSASVTLRVM